MKISVVIPLYNAEDYIQECLESLLNQKNDEFEVIIVDDGSTDASASICKSLINNIDRFHYYYKENGGSNSARILGIEQACGEYILFVDADDWVDENYIELFLKAIKENRGVQFVVSGLLYEWDETKKVEPIFKKGYYDRSRIETEIIPKMFYKGPIEGWGIPPQLAGKLYNRELLYCQMKKLDSRIIYGEDVAFWVPLFINSNSIVIIENYGYHYRLNHLSVNSAYNPRIFESVVCLYKHLDNEIESAGFKEILKKQLELYMFYILDYALNNQFFFDQKIMAYIRAFQEDLYAEKKRIWRFPFNKISGKKILLYGAGKVGQSYYYQLNEIMKNEIVGWVDANVDENKRTLGVVDVKEGLTKEYDCIVIAVKSKKMAEEITFTLNELGVERNKIIWEQPELIGNLLLK